MAQSQILTDFYKAYLTWVEDGAQEDKPFARDRGLCGNLCRFVLSIKGVDSNRFGYFERAENELLVQFESAGLCTSYPFNNGCGQDYRHECHFGYPWQNPQRMEWVRKHANIDQISGGFNRDEMIIHSAHSK